MRTSCNGCRVLRKGCSDDCVIRPCLVWMKSADAQANATVFLAKFYGRAGLLNLLNAGPDHLRPGIFQSLLYEACGRVVDPIYGSVGLLYSGQWHHCQLAVDAVLKGLPIIQLSPSSHLTSPPNNNNNAAPPINTTSTTSPSSNTQFMLMPPLKLYDIRHMSSKDNQSPPSSIIPTGPRLKPRPHLPAFDSDHDCDDVSTAAGDSTEGSSSIAGCHNNNNNNNVHLELTLGFTKLSDMQY